MASSEKTHKDRKKNNFFLKAPLKLHFFLSGCSSVYCCFYPPPPPRSHQEKLFGLNSSSQANMNTCRFISVAKGNPSRRRRHKDEGLLEGKKKRPIQQKLKIIRRRCLCWPADSGRGSASLTPRVPYVPIRYGFSVIYLSCRHVMVI